MPRLDISELVDRLAPDPWRQQMDFSPDIAACHDVLFASGVSRSRMADALTRWLRSEQPCLFGRMEATKRRLAFCVLTENDLYRGDDHIRGRICEERTDWKRRALQGLSHGFIIAAVSERIATARADENLLTLARKLSELYLQETAVNKVHLDELFLELDRSDKKKWLRWAVGVNYFSSQADKKWWHDHRIPGGLAFSMNSVGHMARSLVEDEIRKQGPASSSFARLPEEKLTYWALLFAMKTIGAPREGSTRGTWLVKHGTCPEDVKSSPIDRGQCLGKLSDFSENRYAGLYHTDQTIPSDYFDETISGRDSVPPRDDLFFTYLHSLDDEAYKSMAIGTELENRPEFEHGAIDERS